MDVAVVRPGEEADAADLCVVIDVVRATTTAAVLCHRLGELCAIRSPADLASLPARANGYAVFSELAGLDLAIPRFDNSPVLARDADLGGRTPVLVTTNGTIALGFAAELAREVVLGGFVNLAAIVAHVRAFAPARVAVMPAGNIHKAQVCAEDDACAAAVVAALSGAALDVAAVIANCRADERIVRRLAREPLLAADLDICFALDSVGGVPRVAPGGGGGWFALVGKTA